MLARFKIFDFRKANSHLREPRSWFGPNGQYIRELPCPSCRGRGYTPCTECGIERSRSDCPKCNGKVLSFFDYICSQGFNTDTILARVFTCNDFYFLKLSLVSTCHCARRVPNCVGAS